MNTHPRWRKASASNNMQNCVEVVVLPDGSVMVRDSKDPQGPNLHFTGAEWDAFLDGAVKGEFNRADRLL